MEFGDEERLLLFTSIDTDRSVATAPGAQRSGARQDRRWWVPMASTSGTELIRPQSTRVSNHSSQRQGDRTWRYKGRQHSRTQM